MLGGSWRVSVCAAGRAAHFAAFRKDHAGQGVHGADAHASRGRTRQACWLGTPSISTKHSKHTPIMQYGARAAPLTVALRKRVTPAASSPAASEVSAGSASGVSFRKTDTVGGEASEPRWAGRRTNRALATIMGKFRVGVESGGREGV